jgi:flagellar capping protein FliD
MSINTVKDHSAAKPNAETLVQQVKIASIPNDVMGLIYKLLNLMHCNDFALTCKKFYEVASGHRAIRKFVKDQLETQASNVGKLFCAATKCMSSGAQKHVKPNEIKAHLNNFSKSIKAYICHAYKLFTTQLNITLSSPDLLYCLNGAYQILNQKSTEALRGNRLFGWINSDKPKLSKLKTSYYSEITNAIKAEKDQIDSRLAELETKIDDLFKKLPETQAEFENLCNERSELTKLKSNVIKQLEQIRKN